MAAQGGGFCGQRSVELGMDLSAFDGVLLRVRGDGQTFKLNVKTVGGSAQAGLGGGRRQQVA